MNIAQLPFYWRLKRYGDLSPVPQRFPFQYDFDEDLQLLIQKRNLKTLAHLATIYREDANIGYLQDDNQIARPYGTDFYRFINNALERWGSSTRQILEIGCGGCTILETLKDRGYEVVGIDPGPLSYREGIHRRIRVINDFFPTSNFLDLVDLIFHNDVLEHVAEPVEFLIAQKNQLRENGLIITAVPDCSEGVNLGELSMTMHQHLNYYDLDSLKNVFEAAGLEVLLIKRATYGGSLYCCARKTERDFNVNKKAGTLKFERFLELAKETALSVTLKISEAFERKESVGFYAPLRALPYLAFQEKWTDFRFFDDTENWYGKYFDGVDVPIENFSDLRLNPVDSLFVMSPTFGEAIQSKILESNIPIPSLNLLKNLI